MEENLSKDQQFLKKLTDIVIANLQNENFGVKELAQESGLSLYMISHKLYSINKTKVSRFICEVRLKKAKELLCDGTLTVSEVSYKVGFGSPAYFNKCFREFFGYTPGEVLKTDINSKAPDLIDQIVADKFIPAENSRKRFMFSLPFIMLMIVIAGITGFVIYKPLSRIGWADNLVSSEGKISIAVMPFRNMTGDSLFNIWQESIQQDLISSLSEIIELQIRQKESVNSLLESVGYAEYASISPVIAGKISRKLVASLFVYGSIEKSGNEVRIDAQLIDTKTKKVIKSFNIEKSAGEGNFFQAIDSISKRLANFLLISKLIKENPGWGRFPLSTNSPEALRYSIYGAKAREKEDFLNAISWYSMALAADSNFIDAAFGLENAYAHAGNFDASKKILIKDYYIRDRMSTYNKIYASYAYALSFEAPEESVKYLRQIQQLDDQWPRPAYLLGIIYNWTGQYYNAITEFEKAFSLYKKWGRDYMKNNYMWEGLGIAYHNTGQYKKEKRIYRKALEYIPDEPLILARLALLSYAEKDSIKADRYVEKFRIVLIKKGCSEAQLSKRLGDIYAEAALTDKAEKYYRQALSLEPSNLDYVKVLADFFIENRRNLDESLSLIDKAAGTVSSPYSYYEFMDMKGRCLLRQGRNREALGILENAYNSTPYKVYHIYSDLLMARKSVADQR